MTADFLGKLYRLCFKFIVIRFLIPCHRFFSCSRIDYDYISKSLRIGCQLYLYTITVCRTLLFDISRKHGVHLEQEPSYGGRAYLEKQDYILMKQKEQLAAQEQKLEELTLKIEDVETLVEEVSDIAYDKAVEVVTDTVRQETHKEDLRLVEETKNWVLSPERKAPQKEREYAAARLDGVISKIKNTMQSALTKIQKKLMQPEVKQAGKQQIQEKAKESILAFLKKAKQDSTQRESNRKKRQEKQDMEL